MKLTINEEEKTIKEGSVIKTNKNYFLVIKEKDSFRLLNIETCKLVQEKYKDLEAISNIYFIRDIYDTDRIEMIIK